MDNVGTKRLILCIFIVLFYTVAGYYAGYRMALAPSGKIAEGIKDYTLGDLLSKKNLEELIPIYMESEKMKDHIQDVLFEPVKSYAPYVGDVPSKYFKIPKHKSTDHCCRIFLTGGSTAFGSGYTLANSVTERLAK